MNGPVKFTLSAFSLALAFEACTIKKVDVGPQEKEESTLAMQQEEKQAEKEAEKEAEKQEEKQEEKVEEAVLPTSLQDRLYPKKSTEPLPKMKPETKEYNRLYPNQPYESKVNPIPKTAAPMLTNPSIGAQYASPSAPATSYSPSQEKGGRPLGDQGARYYQEMSPAKRSMDKMARAEYDIEAAEGLRCRPNYPYSQPPRQNSEEYASLYENSFMNVKTSPLSTFSIDVDGASYSNTRRFLQEGQLPPSDAIRIEEFINYFSYDYPQPTGSDPFSIITEVATTPWNPETKLVHIGLQGRRSATENLPPSNLVFLIDVSGSMASEDKLPLLKNGFDMLIDQLRPQDQISIVVYAGAAGMVLSPTSGADKDVIREALSRLDAGGSTAGGAGLMLAYQAAKSSFIKGGNNRVILATDGDFNVGISNDQELVRLIEEKRKSGVFLSVLGFGTGNIKDAKMEQLADKGNGNYFYIDNINEARKVLVEKMAGTLFAIAKDVKLQIEFNPALVKSYRLVGYENRVLAAEDFNDDKKDAGELGSGTNVTALYEIVPVHAARPKVDPLKYQNGGSRPGWNWGFGSNEAGGELLTVKFRYKQPTGNTSKLLSRTLSDKNVAWQDASQNFRFSAAAAGFALVLRNSQYRGNLDLEKVAAIGRGAKGRDLNGHRAEFLSLVETAKSLGGYSRVD